MEEIILQVPSDFRKYESQSNGKMKLTFVTQENISPEVQAKIVALGEKFGWLSFMPEKQIDPSLIVNLPKLTNNEEEQKSPAQVLRGVIYRLWEQQGKPTQTSESFYRMHMEKIINAYKEKLT